MNGRPLALAGLLGAAVGGPYVMTQAPDEWPNPWGPSTQQSAESTAEGPASQADLATRPPQTDALRGPQAGLYDNPAPLTGPPGLTLEQALRWDVTKNWVYSNWARKSTGLSDPRLFGVRVPLVTGAGMTDVAGSLTYYFDQAGAVQRMRLRGRTADTSRIVYLAGTAFGMTPTLSGAPGEQLFRAYEDKTLRGELRTRPEGVLWGASPHGSFDVFFEATRPGSAYAVTPFVPPLSVADAATSTPSAGPLAQPQGDPVLPPRAVVPDGESTPAAAASPEGASAAKTDGADAAEEPVGGPPTPQLPKFGSPTAAPPKALEPLDGYRDRFRWPG